jgi:muramidase (phage lysozyme)
VIIKIKRKLYGTIRRWMKHRKDVLVLLGLFLVSIITYTAYMQNKRLTVDPATYSQLLTVIADAESKGNYNAYFGNAGNSSVVFTQMPVAEVMEWQSDYIREGNSSSAVGRYQIISTTLRSLVDELKIDTNQLFDKALQDRMAITLIERRGSEAYVNGEISRAELAANLAKEWAALPRVIGEHPDDSYYASDGLNKSLVSVDEILKAIEPISE